VIVAPRVAELAAEAVDPARSDLLRAMSAAEVTHRLTRDNPTASHHDLITAARDVIATAREASS
jgi:hypothetical protein